MIERRFIELRLPVLLDVPPGLLARSILLNLHRMHVSQTVVHADGVL